MKANNIYIFIRKEGFYPIEMNGDEEAIKNAEHNIGTLEVQDTKGRVVWVAHNIN